MLKQLAEGLWEHNRPLRTIGPMWVPRRMTVARLADGGLWLHSPNALDPELKGALDALGPVAFLVAPNTIHHFFVDEYQKAYPAARLYGAPGLAEKRRDLTFHATLGDEPPQEWAEEIDQQLTQGTTLNEVVFHHRASRTLIVADFVLNVRDARGFSKLMFKLTGVYGRCSASRLLKTVFKKDKAALVESAKRISASWDIRRIVMSHGEVVEDARPGALQDAFARF